MPVAEDKQSVWEGSGGKRGAVVLRASIGEPGEERNSIRHDEVAGAGEQRNHVSGVIN